MKPDSNVLWSKLPFHYQAASHPSTWWLRDESWSELAERAVRSLSHRESIAARDLLKQGTRRLVFRLPPASAQQPEIVVKAFPLDTVRHRLRHKKYAYSEASNLIIAGSRGLPVPQVYAFGFHKRLWLTQWNAVCMTHLGGRSLLQCLREGGQGTEQWPLLQRATGLFKKLFDAGCNHIDCGPQAILLAEDPAEDSLIDFQYCSFRPEPSPRTLAYQAGYFVWSLTTKENLVGIAVGERWFEDLLRQLSLADRAELWDLFRSCFPERHSIKDRLAA